MRIGYFGGSFDPPHRGHLAVALAARDRFRLDRVLLAPTGSQPLKPHGAVASWPDRLRMVELLCVGHPGLQASALDAPDPGGQPNYTVDTLRRLRAELVSSCHPRRGSASPAEPQLFAIVGADAFQSFPHWREPGELLRLADWIIVSRPDAPLPQLSGEPATSANLLFTPAQRTHLHLLEDLADPTSATALRARLASGQDCQAALTPSIVEWIRAAGLYRSEPA